MPRKRDLESGFQDRLKKDIEELYPDAMVFKMDGMSFSRFIYPENKEEVLNELQQAFESDRPTRFSRCE